MKHAALLMLAGLVLSSGAWAQTTQPAKTADAPPPSRAEAIAQTQTADFRAIVQDAKEKVFPAVVFIKCLRKSHESGKKTTEEVVGSGVIVSATGEVISNWHVVDKAVEIRCLLYDGSSFEAEVVGMDKDTDLSLLKPKLPKDADVKARAYPFAKLGDSAVLREGDFVMAMGAPWGLNRSVSIGIVSCTRRFLKDNSEYSLWLQTDASISPGNSGGPLVNTAGEVIGINTRGSTSGAGDMGFAVPSTTIRIITKQLREHGKVNWSWTGLQLQPLRDFMKNIYFKGDQGVIVAEIDPDSPAMAAGLKKDDRILKVNGQPLTALWSEDLPAARRFLGMLPKGKKATFEIQRNGKTLSMDLTPRAKGKVEGEEQDCPRWNMTVKAINQFENEALYFYRKKGVFIFGIKYPGNAAQSGLAEQDIILKIGNRDVKTLEDVKVAYDEAMANIKKSSRILITVLRNGLMQQAVLDFSRDYEKQ